MNGVLQRCVPPLKCVLVEIVFILCGQKGGGRIDISKASGLMLSWRRLLKREPSTSEYNGYGA